MAGPGGGRRDVCDEWVAMKFLLEFSYTPEAWAGMMKNPMDRRSAARTLIESVGGQLESMYYTFGERDGFLVMEMPDAEAAAAAAVAANSTGAFRMMRTVELVEPEQLGTILGRAGGLVGGYRAPGT
ncbi:MAG: GYD domain-containing protein [Pseudonocardia sp.]